MQHEINQTTGLSQKDEMALALGRKLLDAFRREEAEKMLDKTLHLVVTNPNLSHYPYINLIDNLFMMKWIFASFEEPTI